MAYDTQGYSTQALTSGGFISFRFPYPDYGVASGLSSSPAASATMDTINHCFVTNAGSLYIYESGTQVASLGTISALDTLSIHFTTGTITYKKNNDTVHTSATGSTTFYFDSSMDNVGGGISHILMGMSTRASNTKGRVSGGNISTYIADAAIKTAHIAEAQIDEARILDLSVTAVKIRGNAVSYITKANSDSVTLAVHGTTLYPSSIVIIAKANVVATPGAGDNTLTLTINGDAQDSSIMASAGDAIRVPMILQTTYQNYVTGTMTIAVTSTNSANVSEYVINVLEVLK